MTEGVILTTDESIATELHRRVDALNALLAICAAKGIEVVLQTLDITKFADKAPAVLLQATAKKVL